MTSSSHGPAAAPDIPPGPLEHALPVAPADRVATEHVALAVAVRPWGRAVVLFKRVWVLAVVLALAAIIAVIRFAAPQVIIAFDRQTSWHGGYTAQIFVKNETPSVMRNWRMEFDLPPGSRILRHWGATMSSKGRHYVIHGDHAGLKHGQSTQVEFIVQGAGSPKNCRLNDAPCDQSKDREAPTEPTGLKVTGASVASVRLAWNPATDNVAVSAYRVYMDGKLAASTSETATSISRLPRGSTHRFAIAAVDMKGNESKRSAAVMATTSTSSDVRKPSTPQSVRPGKMTTLSATLSWEPSNDNVEVVGYNVYEGANVVATTTKPTATVTGLPANSKHTYRVTAVDDAENESAKSKAVTVTTAKFSVRPRSSGNSSANRPTSSVIGPTIVPVKDDTSDQSTQDPQAAAERAQQIQQLAAQVSQQAQITQQLQQQARQAQLQVQQVQQQSDQASQQVELQTQQADAQVKQVQQQATLAQQQADQVRRQAKGQVDLAREQQQKAKEATDKARDAQKNAGNDVNAQQQAQQLIQQALQQQQVASQAAQQAQQAQQQVLQAQQQAEQAQQQVKQAELQADSAKKQGEQQKTQLQQQITQAQQQADQAAKQAQQAQDALNEALAQLSAAQGGDTTPSTPGSSGSNGSNDSGTGKAGGAAHLRVLAVTDSSVTLNWQAPADAASVGAYDILKDGQVYQTVGGHTTTAVATGLDSESLFQFSVVARDHESKKLPPSNTVKTVTTAAGLDSSCTPANLHATAVTSHSVSLDWDAPAGGSGIAAYDVYSDGALLATVRGTSATIDGLTGGTDFSFVVKSRDGAGKNSPASKPASVKTLERFVKQK